MGWPSRAPGDYKLLGSGDAEDDAGSAPVECVIRFVEGIFKAFFATTRPKSWEVSVASREEGGMPNSVGSKESGGINPPRLQ